MTQREVFFGSTLDDYGFKKRLKKIFLEIQCLQQLAHRGKAQCFLSDGEKSGYVIHTFSGKRSNHNDGKER